MSKQYILLTNDLIRNNFTASELLLLNFLARKADEKGYIFGLSHQTIAAGAKLPISTAYAVRKTLETKGILKTERMSSRRGGRSHINRYHIDIDTARATGGTTRIVSSERHILLAARAMEAAEMLISPSNADFAAAANWLALLDKYGAPEELIIDVIRSERLKPQAKRAYALNYYTKPITRELASRENQFSGTPHVEPIAAVTAAETAARGGAPAPQPSAVDLTRVAMTWANLNRPPKSKEIATVNRWMQSGATGQLIETVISSTINRVSPFVPAPATLHYFDTEMNAALSGNSS